MNHSKKILYNTIIFTLMISTWLSCKDDETDQLALTRRFKPAEFEIAGGETTAIVAWSPSLFTRAGEVEYMVEISKDGTDFSNVEVTKTTADPGVIVTDTEIDIKTDYYARVKAIGADGTDDSNWLVSEPFQITGQVFILPVQEFDVVTDAVKIKWEVEDVVTKIVVTPQGGTPVEVTVSGSEATAGEKTIGGLTANTNYTAEIFKGDVTKGLVTFRTKNSFATSNVVDLRNITGKRKILADTLGDIPSGSVIFLKRGQIYEITSADASRNLSKSVTIVSGPDFNAQLARIHMVGANFNFVANSVIDSVVFRDVIFKGARITGGFSFDNDYIFNVNAVTTVTKIRLENCKVSQLRGTVRLQTGGAGAKVQNYTVNNCVIDSIRDFSVMHAGAASAFANVKISNSTFFRCRKFMTHGAPGNNSLVIENCTINEAPTGSITATPANFFIDFFGSPNTYGSATPIVIKNCIIGKSWVETAGSADVGGIRASATSVNVTNTYTLSDFVSGNATFQLPGVSAYPGTSTSVFQNPAGKDFHIKDPAFPGATTAGDPRWR